MSAQERWFVTPLTHWARRGLCDMLAEEGNLPESPTQFECRGKRYSGYEVRRGQLKTLEQSEHVDDFLAFHQKGGGVFHPWPFAGRGRIRPGKQAAKRAVSKGMPKRK